MTVIALVLDSNPDNIVWSGQIAIGHVRIVTEKRIKMRGVRVELRGKGYARWTGLTGSGTTNYTFKDDYINQDIYLTGSRNNASELYLEPGAHKFLVVLGIPSTSPQSFESKIGHVRYTAKVVIDRPMRLNSTTETKLTVARHLDLNNETRHMREFTSIHNSGQVLQTYEDFCCCDCNICCCNWRCCVCCISGSVETSMTVNRRCFVPGETIRVEGEFRNVSSDEVKRTSIVFVQRIAYGPYGISSELSNVRENVLATVWRPGLAQGQSDRFQNIQFLLPYLPPSRLDGCRFIHIAYFVELRVHYSVLTSCNGRIQIIIGNVPPSDVSQQPVVTSQPGPSSIATSHPVPSSTVTSQSVPFSIATSQPGPSSIATSHPVPSSTVTSHPVSSSIATSHPVLSSTVTSQPVPSSLLQPSTAAEFSPSAARVAHL